MALARKIILHSPVSNEAALPEFVEQCLRDEVSLLAIYGAGCADLEETIDWLVVGNGDDSERFLCTTSHPNEPFDDVVNMVVCWEFERNDSYQEILL